MSQIEVTLPVILAGPQLRHATVNQLVFWLVTSNPCQFELQLFQNGQTLSKHKLSNAEHHQVQVGKHCFIHLLNVNIEKSLPRDHTIEYELLLNDSPDTLKQRLPQLCYPGNQRPEFVIKSKVDNLLHGSCRKPHHESPDGLLQVDPLLNPDVPLAQRPAMMIFSGDQIYADDVAGPTLCAIHQVIQRLGLFNETWQGTQINCSQKLFSSDQCFYLRPELLPKDKGDAKLLQKFFAGASKPIFTSVGAHNHLVTLSEVIAMYLLVWSPVCWQQLDLDIAKGLDNTPLKFKSRYQNELEIISDFVDGLETVQRVMAHIPTYMIFDDHDITDDWNLTRGWEEAAYGHPFSRRIIGNTLIGYWLCQGWANRPQHFNTLAENVDEYFQADGVKQHEQLVDTMLSWSHWHYHLDTNPKVVVLDTRTHRWRSESNPNKPSGLMDWEALSEMQQELIGQEAVILVSPAPIFGVKLIEAIQRIFTFFGKPLVVDAENWMAHPGAANVMLNIFRHAKTPPHFVILSGDVHYSFVYDITLRFRKSSPQILQVTASGIKNCFPAGLLRWFDRINLWLYGSKSPLNFLTKRRNMRIKRRQPQDWQGVLFNRSGMGQVLLSDDYEKIQASVLCKESETRFLAPEE